jgi:hypothetical protein
MLCGFHAAGMHHVHTVRQRIAHTFQHRTRQLCRAMLMRQAKNTPFASGLLCGVRSPERYGKNQTGPRFIRLLRRAISAGTLGQPVSFAAQSRQDAALSITDIKCQRPATHGRKLCTALSGLLETVADGKIDTGRPQRQHRLTGITMPTPTAPAALSPPPATTAPAAYSSFATAGCRFL